MNILDINKNTVSFNGNAITNDDITLKDKYSIIKIRSLNLLISLLDIPIVSSDKIDKLTINCDTELKINELQCDKLIINSKETTILNSLITKELTITSKLINEKHLTSKYINGKQTLVNKGYANIIESDCDIICEENSRLESLESSISLTIKENSSFETSKLDLDNFNNYGFSKIKCHAEIVKVINYGTINFNTLNNTEINNYEDIEVKTIKTNILNNDGDMDIVNISTQTGSNNGKLKCKMFNFDVFTNNKFMSVKDIDGTKINNLGTLVINKADIDYLENNGHVLLYIERHRITNIVNNKLITLLKDNWIVSNKFLAYAKYLLSQSIMGTGTIESNYVIDIRGSFNHNFNSSKELKIQNDLNLDYFKTNHLTFFYHTNFLYSNKFSNFSKLDLTLNSDFHLKVDLKVENFKFEVRGKLTVGIDNNNLIILASTKGELYVKAKEIDFQFAKVYGKKKTTIGCPEGNLRCGFYSYGKVDYDKRIGVASSYTDVVGHRQVATTVYDVNGAYIASDDNINLWGNRVILDYGQVTCQGNLDVVGNDKISMKRSIITGSGSATFRINNGKPVPPPTVVMKKLFFGAKISKTIDPECNTSNYDIFIGRESMVSVCLGWMSSYYTNDHQMASTSDETKIHFGKSIKFTCVSLGIVASTISSKENIHFGQIDLLNNPSSPNLNICGQSAHRVSHTSNLISADQISIQMDGFSISATMNSPFVTISSKGNGRFNNTSKSRTEFSSNTIVYDLTSTIQNSASGIYKTLKSGEVITDFELGNNHNMPKLYFGNQGTGFNPLRSLNLEPWIQMAYASVGKVNHHTYDSLISETNKWITKNNTNIITKEQIDQVTGSLLLCKIEEARGKTQEILQLIIGADDINVHRNEGTIACVDFKCHTDGNQEHLNNEIIAENKINISSNETATFQTETYETFNDQGRKCYTKQTHAMPQQTLIAKDINITSRNTNLIASKFQSQNNIDFTSDNINEHTVILPTTSVEASRKRTVTTTNHNFLQTSLEAGNQINYNVENINLIGSIHYASKINYNGKNYNNSSVIVPNVKQEINTNNTTFSKSKQIDYQESAAVAISQTIANIININCKNISANGVVYSCQELNTHGGKFGPLIKTLKCYQQSMGSSPLMKYDIGSELLEEVELRTIINATKINTDKLLTLINADVTGEIKGQYETKIYELKKIVRNWKHVSQVVPTKMLIVAAIVVTVLTKGAGAKLLACLNFGKISAAVLNTTFSLVASTATTSLLRTGNPIDVVKGLTNKQFIKDFIITTVSAGLIEHFNSSFNILPGQKSFNVHLLEHTIKNVCTLTTSAIINQSLNSKQIIYAATNILMDSIGGKLANLRSNVTNPIIHKIMHGIDAFSIGYLHALLINVDKMKMATSRAIGAMITESIVRYVGVDGAIIINAIVSALLKLDINESDKAANNALINNHLSKNKEIEEDEEYVVDYSVYDKMKKQSKKSRIIIFNEKYPDGKWFGEPSTKSSSLGKGYDMDYQDVLKEQKYEANPELRKLDEFYDKQANNIKNFWNNSSNLELVSYLPIPFLGSGATIAVETIDIYDGKKTITESGFDLTMGYIGGKAMVYTGQGLKYIGKKIISGSSSLFESFLRNNSSFVSNNIPFSYSNPKHGLYFGWDLPNAYTKTSKSNIYQGYQSFTDNLNNGKYYYGRNSGSISLDSDIHHHFLRFESNLMKDSKAPFYVNGHGNLKYIYQNDTQLDHRDLAKIIKNSSYKSGTPIILGSCHVGGDKFAQDLANKLGVPVQAPSDYYIFDVRGTFRVSTSNNLRDNLSDGNIKTFWPGNKKEGITINFNDKQLNPVNSNFTENLDFGTVNVQSSNINQRTWMTHSWDRYLTQKDLKRNLGKLNHLSADVKLKDRDMNIFLEYIEGDGIKFRNLKESIINYAKSHGAESLKIEMMVRNKKLRNHLIKHHDMKVGEFDFTLGLEKLEDPKYFDMIDIKL